MPTLLWLHGQTGTVESCWNQNADSRKYTSPLILTGKLAFVIIIYFKKYNCAQGFVLYNHLESCQSSDVQMKPCYILILLSRGCFTSQLLTFPSVCHNLQAPHDDDKSF